MARKKRVTTATRSYKINEALGELEAKAQAYASNSRSEHVYSRTSARNNLATAAVAYSAVIKAAQRDGRR
jgi:hypothetical protein